jgi:hypothetical protein
MILLSLKYSRSWKSLKNTSLVILVEVHRPDVLMIQETMGVGHKLVKELGKSDERLVLFVFG